MRILQHIEFLNESTSLKFTGDIDHLIKSTENRCSLWGCRIDTRIHKVLLIWPKCTDENNTVEMDIDHDSILLINKREFRCKVRTTDIRIQQPCRIEPYRHVCI